jgi:hypothetical protein
LTSAGSRATIGPVAGTYEIVAEEAKAFAAAAEAG